ncbi:MAG: hypothetical protein KGR26_03215 [Cyanobacteria bacterium REEB65]|nr:hypothetical protein [Cyanobacteria bacterium REEB65]
MPRTTRSNAGSTSALNVNPDAFSEELADGALEMIEVAYSTVASYRDGWEYIHPQDQEDWLTTFMFLREPAEALTNWRAAGRLNAAQIARHDALLKLIDQFDPLLADLDTSGRVFGKLARNAPSDDFELI